MVTPITKKQIKAIWAVAKEKGISREDVYELIYQLAEGKEHMSEMTKEEANRVIDRLFGKKPTPYGMITSKQENKIRELEKQLGWHTNPRRLKGYIHKTQKVDDISWLTVRQASNVIEGLKRQVKALENKGKINK